MPPRLIPPTIAADTPSEGERVVFDALALAKGADDWVVLHSLDLANHRRRLAGEIDFLLIVPGKGVLVLEVKGTHHVRRHDGLWFYGSDPRPDERGPFKQASEAMHSLRDRLVHRHRDLARVVFWSAVCFPFVDFVEASEEWHPWQVIDRRAMAARPLASLCESVLDHARQELVAHGEPWFHAERHEPREQQVDELLRALRGDFEFFESPKSRARRLDDEVRRYTEEQFEALDTIDANPRVVFDGPAGTGKTLLAVEAARRGAVAGRRVLLLCFNRPLGRWLQEETEDLRPMAGASVSGKGPGVVTRTLHEHLRLLAGVTPTPVQVCSQGFWQEELPELAAQALLELIERASRDGGRSREVYDEIVLDEAQDVLRQSYLDVLDLSLAGGLDAGTWRFFGDFAYQRIYDAAALTLDQMLAPRRRLRRRRALRAARQLPQHTAGGAARLHLRGRRARLQPGAPSRRRSRTRSALLARRGGAEGAPRRGARRTQRARVQGAAGRHTEPPRRRSLLCLRLDRAALEGPPCAVAQRGAGRRRTGAGGRAGGCLRCRLRRWHRCRPRGRHRRGSR